MSVPAGSVSYLPFAHGEKAESRSQLKHISRLQPHNVQFKPEKLARQRNLGDKRCGLKNHCRHRTIFGHFMHDFRDMRLLLRLGYSPK